VALSLVFFLAAASNPVQGVTYASVGVKKGDWAEYSVNYPGIPFLSRIRIDITSVSGSVVAFNETWYNTNGNVSQKFLLSFDITKPLTSYDLAFSLISTNLTAMEPTCPGSDLMINSTRLMFFAGANRSCNVCYVNSNYGSHTLSGYYIWDQATGLFLAYNLTSEFSNGGYTETEKIISTDLWPAPSGITAVGTTALIVIGVTTAAIAVTFFVAATRQKPNAT
jgi:hypothetical protein